MIFHIKKVYLCISFYFFIMLGWVILTHKIEEFLLCLFALIIHEIGHIIMVYVLKENVSIFYILPFGFCCRLKNQSKISNKNMTKILLAGPATSVCVAGFLILWTKEFALANFIVGVFNLLPIGNLDGGRMSKLIENK